MTILTNLPNLLYLNGKPTLTGNVDIDDKQTLDISLNKETKDFNVFIFFIKGNF